MTSTMRALIAFRRLYPSLQEHRQVEAETLRLLKATLPGAYLGAVPPPAGILKYARRHFFSSLFLAVYRSAGVAPERRLFYGGLNHAIRGIVTGTDNLLDDEYKEMLPLAFPERATRFKSVMHILLFDRILFRLLDEAAAGGLVTASRRGRSATRCLPPWCRSAPRKPPKRGAWPAILTPAEILASVHMYKGGNLLRLAFVAPLLAETRRSPRAVGAGRPGHLQHRPGPAGDRRSHRLPRRSARSPAQLPGGDHPARRHPRGAGAPGRPARRRQRRRRRSNRSSPHRPRGP